MLENAYIVYKQNSLIHNLSNVAICFTLFSLIFLTATDDMDYGEVAVVMHQLKWKREGIQGPSQEVDILKRKDIIHGIFLLHN